MASFYETKDLLWAQNSIGDQFLIHWIQHSVSLTRNNLAQDLGNRMEMFYLQIKNMLHQARPIIFPIQKRGKENKKNVQHFAPTPLLAVVADGGCQQE